MDILNAEIVLWIYWLFWSSKLSNITKQDEKTSFVLVKTMRKRQHLKEMFPEKTKLLKMNFKLWTQS